jgi:deoxyribose-phosphate aldolase
MIGNHDEEERLEAELWATRLGAQAAYDMMFYGRVNGGNMEAIDQLPLEVRQLALENAVNRAIIETGEINMLEKQASERFQLAASETADWVEIE